jgi:hypothetical protein
MRALALMTKYWGQARAYRSVGVVVPLESFQGLEVLGRREQSLGIPITACRLHECTVVLYRSCVPRLLWQRSLGPLGTHVRLRVSIRGSQRQSRVSGKSLAPVIQDTGLREKKRSWAVQVGKLLAENTNR